jgi:UDP-glucose 4-epimerase
MRFLVSGGAGFIGSNLVDRLAEDSSNFITVVDNLSTGHIKNISKKPNIKFIKADVNKIDEVTKVFKSEKTEIVYHYAAVVGVKRTLENPISVLDDIDGIKNILELSRKHNVKKVLFASSSEVYGEPVEIPQHEETTPLNSRLPYAVVKNVAESYLRSYNREYGLEYTIFRFFNTYGPRQSTDFVMSKFLLAAMKNKEITIYGDGSQTRTFCYVDDNNMATINALDDKESLNQVINIGSDEEISILDLAHRIINITRSKSKIVHLSALKEGDMTRRQPDITKMKKLLGHEFTPMDDGIRKLLNYSERVK